MAKTFIKGCSVVLTGASSNVRRNTRNSTTSSEMYLALTQLKLPYPICSGRFDADCSQTVQDSGGGTWKEKTVVKLRIMINPISAASPNRKHGLFFIQKTRLML